VDEEVEPGVCQRRIHPLTLLNAATPQLHLTAVLSHRLTPDSPMVQLGLDAIARASGAVMVLVEGSDEVTGSSLLQVHHYRLEDILHGRTFADLVSEDSQGRRRVDFGALDRTRPIG
jgi:inward rectifier potassium channel